MKIKSLVTGYAGTSLLVLTLCGSLALNVYQALKLNGVFAPRSPEVRVGTKLPAQFTVTDAEGKPALLNLAEDSRPTVVYVLSPLCGWCKRNEANIKAL